MTAPAATAPLLDGQLIGITYHAVAAVRDRMLADSGLTFHRSVALKAVAEGLDRAGAAERLTATLKIEEPEANALLDEITSAGLFDGAVTERGATLQRSFMDAVTALAERLYGDLPDADREVTARALAHVTARANAELAAR
ncbi:hypothetical protein ACIQHY_25935 [Streptomyces sp. NPDC092359]|uniref:hypothetical protein n=1 Tax=Streptomyces sp. NPDC092359 TaxID=3366014 RepID=UPI00382E727A